MKRFLIVGLGNPGPDYENTRHNIGFMFLDAFAKSKNLSISNYKFNGFFDKFVDGDAEYFLAKPNTYMNLSGNFVLSFINYYKISVENILVVYDDLDLPIFSYKLKANGSSGGQKGIQNIIDLLKTKEIKRIKIGIDKPQNKSINISSYVLSKFNKSQMEELQKLFSQLFPIIEELPKKTFPEIMNKYQMQKTNKNEN